VSDGFAGCQSRFAHVQAEQSKGSLHFLHHRHPSESWGISQQS